MADVKLKAVGAVGHVLASELNTLGNNAVSGVSGSGSGAAYDNNNSGANLFPWADLVVKIAAQGGSRTAGATVSLYMTPQTDGSNYDDANTSTSLLIAVINLDAATTARQRTIPLVPLMPCSMKFFLLNSTGQALAGSGNFVDLYPRYDQIV